MSRAEKFEEIIKWYANECYPCNNTLYRVSFEKSEFKLCGSQLIAIIVAARDLRINIEVTVDKFEPGHSDILELHIPIEFRDGIPSLEKYAWGWKKHKDSEHLVTLCNYQ